MAINNKAKKVDKGLVATTIVVVVLVLLVAVILVAKLIDTTGLVNRMTTVATSKNTSASECVLAYYEYESMEDQLNECYYYWMYYSYGLMEDTYGVLDSYSDYAEYAINVIAYNKQSGIYQRNALEVLKTYLTLYEAARAEGIELDENDMKIVNEEYENLTSSALATKIGITSGPQLIKYYTDVKAGKSEIIKAIKIKTLATKYYSKYSDTKAAEYEDAFAKNSNVFDEYVSEHKADLYSAKYKTYTYTAADADASGALTGVTSIDEMRANLAKYIADKNYSEVYSQYMDNVAEMPADLDTAAEMSEILSEVLETEEATTDDGETAEEETTESETTVADTESSESEEETTVLYDYADAKALVINKLQTLVSEENGKITESSELTQKYEEKDSDEYNELSEALQWVIYADKGATKFVQTPAESDTDTTVSCVLYEVVAASSLDETLSKDYNYASFSFKEGAAEGETSSDGTEVRTKEQAKADAEAFKKAFEASGWISTYSFKVVTSISDINETLTDAQSKTDVKDDDVAADLKTWVNDSSRKAGDLAIVEGESAYYVVHLAKINSQAWVETVIDAKVAEDYEAYVKQAMTDFGVALKPKYQKIADDYDAENSTAETEAE